MPAAHAGAMSQRGSPSWRWSRGACLVLSWGWPISCLFRQSTQGRLCWRKRSLGLSFQSGRSPHPWSGIFGIRSRSHGMAGRYRLLVAISKVRLTISAAVVNAHVWWLCLRMCPSLRTPAMLHRMVPRQFAWSFTQERKPSFIYDVSEGLVYVDRRWGAVFMIILLHVW